MHLPPSRRVEVGFQCLPWSYNPFNPMETENAFVRRCSSTGSPAKFSGVVSEIKNALVDDGSYSSSSFHFDRLMEEQRTMLSRWNKKPASKKLQDNNDSGLSSCASIRFDSFERFSSIGGSAVHFDARDESFPTKKCARPIPRKTNAAFLPISNDKTKSFVCGCGMRLLIPKDAKIYFCPGCNMVASTELATLMRLRL